MKHKLTCYKVIKTDLLVEADSLAEAEALVRENLVLDGHDSKLYVYKYGVQLIMPKQNTDGMFVEALVKPKYGKDDMDPITCGMCGEIIGWMDDDLPLSNYCDNCGSKIYKEEPSDCVSNDEAFENNNEEVAVECERCGTNEKDYIYFDEQILCQKCFEAIIFQKQGKWLTNSDRPDTLICSACNHGVDMWSYEPKDLPYCPNCGAEMSDK